MRARWSKRRRGSFVGDMDYEGGGIAVCVTVDGSRKILSGLSWQTTAGDLIHNLRPNSGPQILVENWRGCMRPIDRDELVGQILEDWGDEAKHVSLVLMSARRFPGAQRRLDTGKIYAAQVHGKVAGNKKRCLSRLKTPRNREEVGKEVARLVARAEVARERLDEVEQLEKRMEETDLSEVKSYTTELRTPLPQVYTTLACISTSEMRIPH